MENSYQPKLLSEVLDKPLAEIEGLYRKSSPPVAEIIEKVKNGTYQGQRRDQNSGKCEAVSKKLEEIEKSD